LTSPSREGLVRRGDVDIHYLEWDPAGGPVAPSILLLHGLGSNARYWDRVAGHITTRRRIALDLIPAAADGAAMSQLIADVAFIVAELGLGRPVVVGHSWGAGLALELVVARPGLASGLVFVDGPIHGVARIYTWEEVQARMQPELRRYASPGEAAAETRAYLGEAWAADLEPYVEAGLKAEGDHFVPKLTSAVRLRILRDLHESDPERLWPAVSVPASALIARKSDPTIGAATDRGLTRLAEVAPDVAVRRFATPHDIPLYAPAEVAREIEVIAARAGSASPSPPASRPHP
jgi:pimeloyl-ACP methyl ester carboxylesterase